MQRIWRKNGVDASRAAAQPASTSRWHALAQNDAHFRCGFSEFLAAVKERVKDAVQWYLEMTRELSLCLPLSWSLWMLPTPLLDIPSSRSLRSNSSTFSLAWLTSRPSRADRSSASSRRLRSSSSSPRNCSRLRWRRTRSVTRLFTWIGRKDVKKGESMNLQRVEGASVLWLAANPFICRADSRWWTGGMVRWANRARANPQEEVTSTSLSQPGLAGYPISRLLANWSISPSYRPLHCHGLLPEEKSNVFHSCNSLFYKLLLGHSGRQETLATLVLPRH